MSVFDNPIRKGKWHCKKCNTWCMDSTARCALCSAPKPTPPPPPKALTSPPKPKSEPEKRPVIPSTESAVPTEQYSKDDRLRCYASEMAGTLFDHRNLEQLKLLKMYVDGCVERIENI